MSGQEESVSKPKKKRSLPLPADRRRSRPWVIGGINYGPAIGAVADLATWALDLAAEDVEDWPEGRRRVSAARKYVLDRLRGRRARHAPVDDVRFTASLLARIFDADLELGMTEMVSILDELGLPTDVVPLIVAQRATGPNVGRVVPFSRPPSRDAGRVPGRCPVCLSPRRRNAA
jgi:hypothetical protein